jgi:hypothetical protein
VKPLIRLALVSNTCPSRLFDRFDQIQWSGAKIVFRNLDSLKTKKGQQVKIAPLENDFTMLHVKKTATAQAVRIAPFGVITNLAEISQQSRSCVDARGAPCYA